MKSRAIVEEGRRVIGIESQALKLLQESLDEHFAKVVKAIHACQGKVVTCGMGKAGTIAIKVAATLSSLGTSAFFMHPSEAAHGDLGMIGAHDLILIFSNSGESREIISILPSFKMLDAKIVAVTANPDSTLAREAEYILPIGKHEEACALKLAPTTSTALMLALGDALAVCVMKMNPRFNERDFAFFHPGGSLGKKLLRVDDLMHTDERCVKIQGTMLIQEVLFCITRARAGAAFVVSGKGELEGVFTDGDLRRQLEKGAAILKKPISQVMTKNPIKIKKASFAMEAVKIFREHPIKDLPVLDEAGLLVGVLVHRDFFEIGLL